MIGAIGVSTAVNGSGETVATLTFSGANTEYGSLADGKWMLTINQGNIVDSGGPMASNYVSYYYRLFGDINGALVVNSSDLSIFGTIYGLTSSSPSFIGGFDSDCNGVIDSTDLGRFGQNFGLFLNP